MISSYLRLHDEYDGIPFPNVILHNSEQGQLTQLFRQYHNILPENIEAMEKLEALGVSKESIERFNIGFGDITKCELLQGAAEPKMLERLLKSIGFLSPKGHQLMTGSVFIPIEYEGVIYGAVGRRVKDKAIRFNSSKTPFHLNSDDVLFNLECLNAKPDSILVCKNPFEAIQLIQLGFENSVSVIGDVPVSDNCLSAIKGAGVKQVKLAINAGHNLKARIEELIQKFRAKKIKVRILNLPASVDVKELLQKPNGESVLLKLISQARLVK